MINKHLSALSTFLQGILTNRNTLIKYTTDCSFLTANSTSTVPGILNFAYPEAKYNSNDCKNKQPALIGNMDRLGLALGHGWMLWLILIKQACVNSSEPADKPVHAGHFNCNIHSFGRNQLSSADRLIISVPQRLHGSPDCNALNDHNRVRNRQHYTRHYSLAYEEMTKLISQDLTQNHLFCLPPWLFLMNTSVFLIKSTLHQNFAIHNRELCCISHFLEFKTATIIATSIIHSKLN